MHYIASLFVIVPGLLAATLVYLADLYIALQVHGLSLLALIEGTTAFLDRF